jgi:hypothetical protein
MRCQGLLCLALTAGVLAVQYREAFAESISLPATIDGSYDLLSGNLRTESLSLLAYTGGSTYQYRAALEFDLSGIPAGATIQSAVFRIRYNGANGMPAETLKFNAYPGDGIMSPEDFRVDNQIGPRYNAFGPPADTKPFYEVPATDFIQSLLQSQSAYAGFMVQNVVGNQTAFYSRFTGPSYEPRLDIEYVPVPEPSTLVLVGAAIIGLAAAGGRRKRGAGTA